MFLEFFKQFSTNYKGPAIYCILNMINGKTSIKMSVAIENSKGKLTTEETRNKISVGNKGKIRSDECKNKISKAQKGIKKKSYNLSDEARKKRSMSMKKYNLAIKNNNTQENVAP